MRGANVFHGSGGDIWLRSLSTGVETELFTNNAQITGYDLDFASPPNSILDYGCDLWVAPMANPVVAFPFTSSCQFAAPTVNPANGSHVFC